jgi:exonuclease 3'-5' domain-containing protein 1
MLSQWQRTKKEVVKIFDPKLGGSYEVFNERPLPEILMSYCVGYIQLLPILSATYQSRLSKRWSEKARVETEIRLEESKSPAYKHRGKEKGLGPNS